jgi:hypothetical protein
MKSNRINREERVATTLPVMVSGDVLGLTRDVSVTGIFFEIDTANTVYTLGSNIDFAVELNTPTGAMALKCQGHIVRTESHDSKIGIAVKIIDSFFERASDSRI